MKQTITKSMFRDAFFHADRKTNFSYQGLGVLFDYLKQCEIDSGDEMELDVIAVCYDFSEDTIKSVLKSYDLKSVDELTERTIVINVDDETIIYAVF